MLADLKMKYVTIKNVYFTNETKDCITERSKDHDEQREL